MKKIIILSGLFLILISAMAQNTSNNSVFNIDNQNEIPVKSTAAIVQVLDSTIDYTYNSGWEYTEKEIVNIRHWESGYPWETLFYAFDGGVWNPFIKAHINWYDSITYQTYNLYPWNSFMLDWNPDALAHYSFAQHQTSQFGQVYNDVSFMMSYDFSVNQFTGGTKIRPTMHNDTLYDSYSLDDYNVATSLWEPNETYIFTYTPEGLIKTILHKAYNTITSSYENLRYQVSAYSGTNILLNVEQNWLVDHWENNVKTEYSYNGNNQISSKTKYIWNNITEEWDPEGRHLYTYSVNDLVNDTYQSYSGVSYDYSYRNLYTYDVSGNMLSRQYDSYTGGVWVNGILYEYTFNSNNDRLTYKKSNWNSGLNTWVNSILNTYTYNANFNLTQQLYQSWDLGLLSWVNVEKYDYTFDANFNKTKKEFSNWDNIGGVWEYADKTEYFWSQYDANSVQEIFINPMNVFPNPSNGLININIENDIYNTLTICDNNGKTVLVKSINGREEQIDLTQYGKGYYMITLSNEYGESESRKLMVY
ncbi:MAG: T9SS type A sorting domain-containing protein [Bacteroidales bacterium]|nr:T9SS type A sorting domain-containing protein [Bacteroidales bacterium]